MRSSIVLMNTLGKRTITCTQPIRASFRQNISAGKPRTAKFSALINTGVKIYEFGSRLPRARRGRGRGGQVSTTRLHVNDFPRNSCKDQGRPYQLFTVSEFNPVNIRQTMLCSLLFSRRLLRTCLYTNKPRSTHLLIMSVTLEKMRMSALCAWNAIAG